MKIAFKDVGRGKNNWTAEIDTEQSNQGVADDLAHQIGKNGGLISRDVSADYDEEYNGKIYAGFHMVGTFGPAEDTA